MLRFVSELGQLAPASNDAFVRNPNKSFDLSNEAVFELNTKKETKITSRLIIQCKTNC